METKRFRCTVCGQIFEGTEPPVPCPVCGAGEDAFVCLDTPTVQRWRCLVCGQIFEGTEPPVPCPVCGAGKDAFEPVSDSGPAFSNNTDQSFVIIGGGVAALEAAKAIRERDHTASIRVICGEGTFPYNRPALSDVIADGFSFQSITLEPFSYYGENHIEMIFDEAVSIDKADKTVALKNGAQLHYDKLCIAVGANAFNPLKSGEETIPCSVLRTFDDSQQILEQAAGKPVIVLGGGILGIEAAVALRERGCQVTVVERDSRLMAIQADEAVSCRMVKRFQELGIHVITGISIASLDKTGAVLEDGRHIDASFVLVSIGIRSETGLAGKIGLTVNRGIVVDSLMQTSQPDIYAAGDCAEYNGRVAGLWATAAAQGQAAGAAMAGQKDAEYAPVVPATSFEAVGISLFSAGSIHGERVQTLVFEDAYTGAYRKLVFCGKALQGVLFYGDVSKSGKAIALIEKGASLEEALSIVQ